MNHETVRRVASIAWLLAITVVVAPVAALWVIKLVAAVAGCAPGPQPCTAEPLGQWFKSALAAAMVICGDGLLPLTLVLGGIGAATGSVWRAVAGATAPLAGLILGVIAALSTTFSGCTVSEGGAHGCTLWGADLNYSLAEVAVAPWLLFFGVPGAAVAAGAGAIVASIVRRRYDSRVAKAA